MCSLLQCRWLPLGSRRVTGKVLKRANQRCQRLSPSLWLQLPYAQIWRPSEGQREGEAGGSGATAGWRQALENHLCSGGGTGTGSTACSTIWRMRSNHHCARLMRRLRRGSSWAPRGVTKLSSNWPLNIIRLFARSTFSIPGGEPASQVLVSARHQFAIRKTGCPGSRVAGFACALRTHHDRTARTGPVRRKHES